MASARTGRTAPTATSDQRTPIASTSRGARIAPAATVAKKRLCTTPKTRESTSAGVVRWRSVNPATSSTMLEIPISAKATSAIAVEGCGAMKIIGPPVPATAIPNIPASRRRPTSISENTAPIRPPTPTAELR